MKKRLTSLNPIQLGIVLGVLYAAMGLIFTPFFLLFAIFGGKSGGAMPLIMGIVFAVLMPVMYGIMGFVGGLISAFIYNLVAKYTGGIEFEVTDMEQATMMA